ncbi:hypothetical protein [uncultured Roseibium sp.]|uniref:hypothetical protein n=1 Tax=uncultured Roseibium sp. TaxID=1936171 RepID=UPI00260AF160|nr:hypothetical protein [uncultured Roseibium sp.]
MTYRLCLWTVTLLLAMASPVAAQNVQLRGLPQPGTSLLPSAEQQLNQNLNQQRNEFSTQQQIDRANRLNRVDQINRLNAERRNTANPCAGPGSPCRIDD